MVPQESTCQCRGPRFNPWVRKISWRREWQPTPVFLLGEFHGQRSLAGYSPWGHKESDTTEWLTLSLSFQPCLLRTPCSPSVDGLLLQGSAAVCCSLCHTLFCLRCFCNLWTDEAGCAKVFTQEAALQPVTDRGGRVLNTKASLHPSVGTTLRPLPCRPPEKTSETESPRPTVVPALSCTWSGLFSFPASTGASRAHLPSKLFHSTPGLRTCLREAGWWSKTSIPENSKKR